MFKRADEVLAQGDLEQVVDYVISLNRRKVQIESELDKAKAYLRLKGKEKSKGSFAVDLEGLTGTVTITFPTFVVKAKKDADLKDLEVNIPPEVFSEFFLRTITIVPALSAEDFLEKFEKLDAATQIKIRHFIEFNDRTPNVSVPR